jgi:hypothetical protein
MAVTEAGSEQCFRPVDRPVKAYSPGDRVTGLKQADVGASVGKVRPMFTVVPDSTAGDDDQPTAGESSLIDQIVRRPPDAGRSSTR